MIAIILLILGALTVTFALSFLFYWLFFVPRTREHTEQTQLSDADFIEEVMYLNEELVKEFQPQAIHKSIISQPPITQGNFTSCKKVESALPTTLTPNQLYIAAVKQVTLGKQANSPKDKAFFIEIVGRFEVKEPVAEETIKQNLLEKFKEAQKYGFNFEPDENAINDLAYPIAFEINSGLGTSTEHEIFTKDSRAQYKFQNAKILFNCSPYFANGEKKGVDVEFILQGVEAVDFTHAQKLFNSLPKKFLIDISQSGSSAKLS